MCVVCRMFGAQVCSVVRWLFGCGLLGLLVVVIVPWPLLFLAMPGLCCFLRVEFSDPSIRVRARMLCCDFHLEARDAWVP